MKIRLFCIEDAKGDRAARFIAEGQLVEGDIRRTYGKSPVEALGYLVLIHGKDLGVLEEDLDYLLEKEVSSHLYAEDVLRTDQKSLSERLS